jgi:hypothetical protein
VAVGRIREALAGERRRDAGVAPLAKKGSMPVAQTEEVLLLDGDGTLVTFDVVGPAAVM